LDGRIKIILKNTMTKIINHNTIEIDGAHYTLSYLQRIVDTKSTGANIHRMKNKLAIIGGYFIILKAGEEMSAREEKDLSDAIYYIVNQIK